MIAEWEWVWIQEMQAAEPWVDTKTKSADTVRLTDSRFEELMVLNVRLQQRLEEQSAAVAGRKPATRTMAVQGPDSYRWWIANPCFAPLPERSHGAWVD